MEPNEIIQPSSIENHIPQRFEQENIKLKKEEFEKAAENYKSMKEENDKIYKSLIDRIEESENKITIWDIIGLLIKSPLVVLKIIYYIIKFFTGFIMKDWKTTIGAIVSVLGLVLKIFNVELPPAVSEGLIAIGVFIIGFFATDKAKGN